MRQRRGGKVSMCVRKRARGIEGKPSATRWCSGVRLEHLHPNSVCVCLCFCVCVSVPRRSCQNIHPSFPCLSLLMREQTGFLVSFHPQSPAAGLCRDDWGGGNYRSKQRKTDVQLWEQRFALSLLIAPASSLQFTMQSVAARSTNS